MEKDLLEKINIVNEKRKIMRSSEATISLRGYELEILKFALENLTKGEKI